MAKTFNTNVAENWIKGDIQYSSMGSETKETAEETKTEAVQESKKTVTKKETSTPKKAKSENQMFTIIGKEKKNRQTSLLLKESTYAKLEALATKNGISVNSCINQILEQVLI